MTDYKYCTVVSVLYNHLNDQSVGVSMCSSEEITKSHCCVRYSHNVPLIFLWSISSLWAADSKIHLYPHTVTVCSWNTHWASKSSRGAAQDSNATKQTIETDTNVEFLPHLLRPTSCFRLSFNQLLITIIIVNVYCYSCVFILLSVELFVEGLNAPYVTMCKYGGVYSHIPREQKSQEVGSFAWKVTALPFQRSLMFI